MSETWYAYATGPLDHWGGWQVAATWDDEAESSLPQKVLAAWSEMFWDGFDETQAGMPTLLLSYLPDPINNCTAPLFAVKQNNNGMCFFASTVPLPHLEKNGGSSRKVVITRARPQ